MRGLESFLLPNLGSQKGYHILHNMGFVSHKSATYAYDEAHFIFFGETNNQEVTDKRRYIKMYGRKIYNFALINVPEAMKATLDDSEFEISELKKIFIHQANEKMDEAINYTI